MYVCTWSAVYDVVSQRRRRSAAAREEAVQGAAEQLRYARSTGQTLRGPGSSPRRLLARRSPQHRREHRTAGRQGLAHHG